MQCIPQCGSPQRKLDAGRQSFLIFFFRGLRKRKVNLATARTCGRTPESLRPFSAEAEMPRARGFVVSEPPKECKIAARYQCSTIVNEAGGACPPTLMLNRDEAVGFVWR